jgi:hypothetical protein
MSAIVIASENDTLHQVAVGHWLVVDRQTLSSYSVPDLRQALAHEYTHAIQFELGWVSTNGSSAHSSLARWAQIEGMAVFVQSAYERQYLEEPTDTDEDTFRAVYANGSVGTRYSLAPYLFGDAYFERTVSDPANLSDETRLPRTAEQLLHETDDQPQPPSIRAADDVSQRFTSQYRGEITTRIVLRETLTESRAAAAAEGWGNDRSFGVVALLGEEEGHVWVHRWDSPAEADEFEAAARDHLDNRRAETDEYRFRFVRIDENRTAMIAGNEALIDSIAFETPSEARVVVSLDG